MPHPVLRPASHERLRLHLTLLRTLTKTTSRRLTKVFGLQGGTIAPETSGVGSG